MTSTNSPLPELGFDPVALRRKYREERDRRLRADGEEQYVEMEGRFAKFSEDPYIDQALSRDAVDKNVDVVVLGGGLAGLMSAVSLYEEGIDDFCIIEQAGDFGGTWYWNRYPGIRCDIESYVYMPLLEEVGTVPSEKYANGKEIFEHCQRIGRQYDLYRRAFFQTVVQVIRWDEVAARWQIETNFGDRIRARHVIVSSGPLHRPKLPGIPGIADFKGEAFHTSRWDYQYTGGDTSGNLTGLQDKRVALIGTGATAIQVLPHAAAAAEHLYVFQRTPSAVDWRNNRPTDVAWFKSQPKGWQRRRIDNFVRTLMGLPEAENLVDDCWTDNAKLLTLLEGAKSEQIRNASIEEKMQLADFMKMEQLRTRLSQVINDPETAEALKPWYDLLCKRPLFSDDYYDVFNRSNVTLVDTHGAGVERVTEDAVIVDGERYPVDCIIFATGFRVGVYSYKAGGYQLIGREGKTLADRWADGQRTVHGMKTAGFPNFYIVGTFGQAAQSFNYTHVTAYQAEHGAKIIARCLKDGIETVAVTEEAEQRWLDVLQEKRRDTTHFETECTPGYFNNEGKRDGSPTLLGSMYGGGPFEYVEILKNWIDEDFERDTVRT